MTRWATGVGEFHIPRSMCSENCPMGHVRNFVVSTHNPIIVITVDRQVGEREREGKSENIVRLNLPIRPTARGLARFGG